MIRTTAGDEVLRAGNKNDPLYWERRKKNNEAAKRSRQRRKNRVLALESHLQELKKENDGLRTELFIIKRRFGLEDDRQGSPLVWDESKWESSANTVKAVNRIEPSREYNCMRETTHSRQYADNLHHDGRQYNSPEENMSDDCTLPLCLKKEVDWTNEQNIKPNWVSPSTSSTPSSINHVILKDSVCHLQIKTEN